jgi:hypothetical protein
MELILTRKYQETIAAFIAFETKMDIVQLGAHSSIRELGLKPKTFEGNLASYSDPPGFDDLLLHCTAG